MPPLPLLASTVRTERFNGFWVGATPAAVAAAAAAAAVQEAGGALLPPPSPRPPRSGSSLALSRPPSATGYSQQGCDGAAATAAGPWDEHTISREVNRLVNRLVDQLVSEQLLHGS